MARNLLVLTAGLDLAAGFVTMEQANASPHHAIERVSRSGGANDPLSTMAGSVRPCGDHPPSLGTTLTEYG